MAGVIGHAFQDGCARLALASEAGRLAESTRADLTVGLVLPVIDSRLKVASCVTCWVWSQRVIDLADDDPLHGNVVFNRVSLALCLHDAGCGLFTCSAAGDTTCARPGHARRADPMSDSTAVTHGRTQPGDITLGAPESR